MNPEQLEHQIRDIISEVYGSYFLGKIRVEKLNTIGYKVSFGIPNEDKPTVIAVELDDDKFLKYIRKEIKNAAWHGVGSSMGYKIESYDR